jgi:hypothetical protein
MWVLCVVCGEKGLNESVGGFLIHLRLLGVGHWGMWDSHGEGCEEWKNMYVLWVWF